MKVSQVELPELDEDECEHCALHRTIAEEHETALECAWCGAWNDPHFARLQTVGETNTDEDEEEITRAYVIECHRCGKHTGYIPSKIIWNANHDTYYTGGRRYLPEVTYSGGVQLDHSIEEKIENYTQRILAGEDNLRPWNLRVWIQYAVEAAVADILYKAGVKR